MNSFIPDLSLRKGLFLALWLSLLVFAFGFSPPADPGTLDLIRKLSTGDWQNLNPVVIALFNVMGIWPLIYGTILLPGGKRFQLPAWPFVVGSFFLGAFVLLPYFILRRPSSSISAATNNADQVRLYFWLRSGLFLVAIALGGWAIWQGNWPDYWQQCRNSQFIAVMSSDFLCLTLAYPLMLWDNQFFRDSPAPSTILISE